MSTTPEGRVKGDVRKALHEVGVHPFVEVATGVHPEAEGFYYMPVAGPRSIHGVHDFVGCWHGIFWSIETKAPENPVDETPHQGYFREAVTKTGGVAFTGVRSAAVVSVLRERVRALSRGRR